jgi:hypothetical protein
MHYFISQYDSLATQHFPKRFVAGWFRSQHILQSRLLVLLNIVIPYVPAAPASNRERGLHASWHKFHLSDSLVNSRCRKLEIYRGSFNHIPNEVKRLNIKKLVTRCQNLRELKAENSSQSM